MRRTRPRASVSHASVQRARRTRPAASPRQDLHASAAPADSPLLAAALDREIVTARLRELSAVGRRGRATVRVARLLSTTNNVATTSNRRASILYELERPWRGSSHVFAKHFGNTVQAKRVHDILVTLRREVFRRSRRLGVPEPLGWVPELSLVLYLPVQGRYLDEQILSDRAGESVGRAAEWLAHLHGAEIALDRSFDLANEVANLGIWAGAVTDSFPEVEDVAQRVLSALRESAPTLDLDQRVPIHKDFHYRHVLVGRKLNVFDFDEMRLGDPSFDLGHFCAYLHLLRYRMRKAPPTLGNLELMFLDKYRKQTGWFRSEQVAFFEIYTCVKTARQLCEMNGVEPRPRGESRLREVRAVLEHAKTVSNRLG